MEGRERKVAGDAVRGSERERAREESEGTREREEGEKKEGEGKGGRESKGS